MRFAHSCADAQSQSDIFHLRVIRIPAERFYFIGNSYEVKKQYRILDTVLLRHGGFEPPTT